MERTRPAPTPELIAPERLAKVGVARRGWIRQLVDTSRRNNLLYFRDLKVGTLDLTEAPAKAIGRLLRPSSPTTGGVTLADLVPADRRTQASASLTEIAHEFRQLDKERLRVAVERVQREHAKSAVAIRNQRPDQSALVAREAAKKARHLPLRRLFADASDVLLGLRPCWMASPLSVSQLIPGDRPLFDIVVFDGDADDDDSGTQGFQSILDVMSAFLEPAWALDWHYRSKDEALIAYSNHRIYNGRLVTFPGPGRTEAVRLELVPFVPGQGGQEQSAAREVRRVVDLVVEHAATRPNETLGVITMGIEHAKRIEMALMRERETRPELEAFFAQDRRERFFVKNLERVQGDERDAIIISIGYGKNEAGDLVYRFGPLLQDGGERRLNVAITRARHRMTVVASFSHADMRPDYPKLGVRLLRGFLEAFKKAVEYSDRIDRDGFTGVSNSEPPQSVGMTGTPTRSRSTRPRVSPGRDIDNYSHEELCSMVRWILSDGRLSTDDEIIGELIPALGFQRRGPKILQGFNSAIRSVRGMQRK